MIHKRPYFEYMVMQKSKIENLLILTPFYMVIYEEIVMNVDIIANKCF